VRKPRRLSPDARLPEIIDGWLFHLGATKPSPRTLAAYRADVEGVARRIDTDGAAVLRLEHLTKRALRAAFASWAADHAASSVLRAHSAWSSLFDFLVAKDLVDGNPMAAVGKPRLAASSPKAIKADDAAPLLLTTAAAVGQSRSLQRRIPTGGGDPDRELRARLRAFAKAHPRWGYRRAHAVLVREGQRLNRKKVQRLWREEGLRVPPRRRKRRRVGVTATPADRLTAAHPDHVWALDYQFDVTATGHTIKILHVIDEFTRESLADVVAYSIDADTTVNTLDKIIGRRGRHPVYIRCDNGPELTANALKDWCRFTGTATSYIDPGSPWQNPWGESYGSRMRDELLSIEVFDTLLEAQVLVADWRIEYNNTRPHSALEMLTPTSYAQAWRTDQTQLT
jgi:transposase InsO family protein